MNSTVSYTEEAVSPHSVCVSGRTGTDLTTLDNKIATCCGATLSSLSGGTGLGSPETSEGSPTDDECSEGEKLANAPGQPASVSTKVGLYATACPGFWEPVPSLYIYDFAFLASFGREC